MLGTLKCRPPNGIMAGCNQQTDINHPEGAALGGAVSGTVAHNDCPWGVFENGGLLA